MHVPYRGIADATKDLLSGQIQATTASIPATLACRLPREGAEIISGSPDEFATPIARDLAAWKKLIADAHRKLD